MRILICLAAVCVTFLLAEAALAQCAGGSCSVRAARGGKGLPVVRRFNGERRAILPWRR